MPTIGRLMLVLCLAGVCSSRAPANTPVTTPASGCYTLHGGHVRPDYATGGGCIEKDGLACRSCNGDPGQGPRECFFADDVINRLPAGAGAPGAQYR